MTKIFGHRGAKAYFPENTLMSFQKAMEMGADGLELDIHYSKDGQIVVFHDFTLERMTGASGNIFDFTLAELEDLTVTEFGHTEEIPTLEAVLQTIKDYEEESDREILLNIEFKAGSAVYPGIEERTVALCEKYLKRSQLIYSSFDHYALKAIKAISPDIQTGVLTTAVMVDPWEYVRKLQADFYHPYYMTLFGESLKAFAEERIMLNTYTVNDVQVAEKLMQAGIYSLITDTPDVMLEVRRRINL